MNKVDRSNLRVINSAKDEIRTNHHASFCYKNFCDETPLSAFHIGFITEMINKQTNKQTKIMNWEASFPAWCEPYTICLGIEDCDYFLPHKEQFHEADSNSGTNIPQPPLLTALFFSRLCGPHFPL